MINKREWIAAQEDKVGRFRVLGAIASSLGLLALLLLAFPLLAGGASGLDVDKSAPPVVEAGSVMRYTITVTNKTAQAATQTVVHDSVPFFTTYISGSMTSRPGVLTATQPLTVVADSPMTWTIASLAAGDSISMTFQVTVSRPLISGTNIYNTAIVSSASGRVTTTVQGTADVTVTKTVEPQQVTPGGVVTYTLRLTKTGSGVVQSMTVTDTLPAGFRPRKKVWEWLGAVDFLTLTLSLTATAPTTEGIYHNLVTVTYDGAIITTGLTAPVTIHLRRVYLPLIIRNYPPLSWHQGGGTAGLTVYRVVACPDACQRLYAATPDSGVWSSQDGGRTWATEGLDGTRIHWLEFKPGDCETVYAATWGLGVQKSTGAGGTWQPANTGLGDLYLYVLAIAPDGQTLYAGTAGHGVYKSLDAGTSWFAANNGLPSGKAVKALVIDPTNPQTLYAGLWGAGVYRSDNGGVSWTARNEGLGAQEVYALALDPTDPHIVYAATRQQGVYRSGDEGDHWAQDGLPGQTVYALLAAQGGVVYAGTDGTAATAGGKGVYVRSTSGDWAPKEPQPYDQPVVPAVSLCRNILWLGTTDGVWWYGPD